MLYGKDIIVTPSSTVTGSWTQYSVDLIEVIHVNQKNDPCTPEGGDVRNIWGCITDFMHSDMNCALPWMPKKLGPMCSSPKDYDLYYDSIMGSIYHNTDHIQKVAKCNPACKRHEFSCKLFSTKPDPALVDRWGIKIFFSKDRFPVKEQFYIYDTANIIADFGGYLGLLLGYSLLGFYDSLLEIIVSIAKRCNMKPFH